MQGQAADVGEAESATTPAHAAPLPGAPQPKEHAHHTHTHAMQQPSNIPMLYPQMTTPQTQSHVAADQQQPYYEGLSFGHAPSLSPSHYPTPPQQPYSHFHTQHTVAPVSLYHTHAHSPYHPDQQLQQQQQPHYSHSHSSQMYQPQRTQPAHALSYTGHSSVPPAAASILAAPPSAAMPVPPVPSSSSSSAAPSSVVLVGDRCARLWGLLWHSDFKLRLCIPDSVLFCNGAFHSYLFSSRQHRGEIRKKSFEEKAAAGGATKHTVASAAGAAAASTASPPKMSLESIRATLVRKAEQDAANITPFVAVLQSHDAHSALVKYHALPRVLRSMGTLPESHRLAQASFAGVPHQPDEVDLYQLLHAYVHPLGGARFVSTYRFMSSSGGDGSGAGAGVGDRPRHSLSTVVGRFADRYEVAPEERAFYEPPVGGSAAVSRDREESKESSTVAPHTVSDSVLRECERMTLCVVEWLSRVHGVGVSLLALEFVQSSARKLVLHAVVDVQFQVEPTMAVGADTAYQPSLGMQLVQQETGEGDDDWRAATSASGGADDMGGTRASTDSLALSTSSAPSRAQLRPASASVAGGRTARAARAMTATAPNAQHPSMASSAAAFAVAAAVPSSGASTARGGSFNPASTQPFAATMRALPSRPQSARRPSHAHAHTHAASPRFSSDELEEQLRSTQPPRGLVSTGGSLGSSSSGGGGASLLPRSARQQMQAHAASKSLAFTTLMQFETRTEIDDRLSVGVGRAPPPSSAGTSNASGGGRADFLLFHWRQQAREGHAEVVRLNAELEQSQKAWKDREEQLRSLLQLEERKVTALVAQNQTAQSEQEQLRAQFDAHRVTAGKSASDSDAQIARLTQERDVQALLISRLESQCARLSAESLALASEKSAAAEEIAKLRGEVESASRARVRAEGELGTAQKVRDELLDKLENEEKFARNLAQQLDLMSDWDSFEDMRHLMSRVSGAARNEGARLKELEAMRAQVVRYTKDKAWQEKKAHINKQAKANRKSQLHAHTATSAAHANTGAASGSSSLRSTAHANQEDPVPERRGTDIIYERALSRMAH